MGEGDHQTRERASKWNTDAATDYPIGPDDAGNAVMHAIGFLVTGWRWIVGKITRRF
jgi:hypothetical protein